MESKTIYQADKPQFNIPDKIKYIRLLIIRHGDPDYANDSLTARGQAEANALCKRLLTESVSKVYCSPLGRAQQTASPFLAASGLTADTRYWLREFPRRVVQPLCSEGIASDDIVSCPWEVNPHLFYKNIRLLSDPEKWVTHPMYNKDGFADYVGMVQREFDSLLAENGIIRNGMVYNLAPGFYKEMKDQTTVAFFCHMGIGLLLMSQLAHIAPPLFWQTVCFQPSSVSTVLFTVTDEKSDIKAKIISVGDTAHLEKIGPNYRF